MSADYARGSGTRRREQKAEEDQAAGCDHSGDGRGGEVATRDPECEGLSGGDGWGEGSVQDLNEGGLGFARMLASTMIKLSRRHSGFGSVGVLRSHPLREITKNGAPAQSMLRLR